MNVHSQPAALAPQGGANPPAGKRLLRVIACGSVDHGKSTLLGRLLYESNQLFEDQLDALAADSQRYGGQGDELDYSLLLDGLAAEREQKITIDVAYRFFTTARRKFIVIDAPGHEQYTANMATGASAADLALVLVAANEGLTRQLKRHLVVLSLLGIGNVVVAVNKMDRVGWSEDTFRAIDGALRDFAAGLGIDDIVSVPVAAKSGDNVADRSPHMPWYTGPTLLDHLEAVEPAAALPPGPLRMPIQLVNRHDPDFRGYSGQIVSGAVHVGMTVRLLPSGRTTRVARIVTFDGDLDRAEAGRSVTLTFTDEVDASRGDMVVGINRPPQVGDRIFARVFWMSDRPLAPGQRYLFKLATSTATASVEPPLRVLDLDSRSLQEAPSIAPNEVGTCTLSLNRPVAGEPYAACRETGSFIVIDPETFDTVGMGCIEQVVQATAWLPKNGGKRLARWTETHARSLAKAVSWRTTGSIDTFVVTFVVSGSTKIAGTVAVAEVVTKILIYYLHERVWALVPWGKR
jgi:sulfate adenylyltransferase large subunit